MSTIELEKSIERDSTFVSQQFFARNLTQDLATDFDIDCPYRPIVIHFANAENIQLFENKAALHWIQDRMLERNLESPSFMQNILSRHLQLLPQIRIFWTRGSISADEVPQYKRLVREATLLLSMYYYSGADERTPQKIRDAIVEVRKDDEFGAQNDEFVRRCV